MNFEFIYIYTNTDFKMAITSNTKTYPIVCSNNDRCLNEIF